MRIVQRIGPHSWRVLRDDERDQLKRERDDARAAAQDLAKALPDVRWVGSGLFGKTGPHQVVPREMVFTAREAVAFGYGCAAGGIHDRAEFARDNWGWGQ